jgi:hypothetical protein
LATELEYHRDLRMPQPIRCRREVLLVSALCIASLLPFITKPFHVDDALQLWEAQQIRAHPLDPLGFDVNWYVSPMRMADVTKNPPLVSYYLAAASLIVGWHEAGLHAAMMLPALMVVLGTFKLARQLKAPATLAACATLAAPVFLISATTTMSDVLMLAFFVWSVVCWIDGMRREHIGMLALAALLAALATLSKYFGMALVPLLLVHGLVHRRGRVGMWMLPLLATVAILVAYQLVTKRMYGRGLLFEAAGYSIEHRYGHARSAASIVSTVLIGFAFTGGCAASAVLLWLVARPLRALLMIGAGIGATILLLTIAPSMDETIRSGDAMTSGFLLQFAFWLAAGVALLIVTAQFLRKLGRTHPAEAVLLACWIAGTFAFAVFVNWSVNARSLLAIAPPLAIVAAMATPANIAQRRVAAIAVAASLALSLILAEADASLARCYRDAAELVTSLENSRGPQTIWFQGHWGFQYYAQLAGAKPIDITNWHPAIGDIVIFPGQTQTSLGDLPDAGLKLLSRNEFQPLSFAATMRVQHAGFYSQLWGPLPFAFGAVPPEVATISVVTKPPTPQPR